MKLYNLYKIFKNDVGDPKEIDSYDNLYTYANEGIIQYINEKIRDCRNVEQTKFYTDNIFELINNNSDIFDPFNYRIIPNQLGELKMLDELYKDEDIIEELKNILPESSNVKKELMDLRIEAFMPNKRMNNDYLKEKINSLIKEDNSLILKTLKLLPKKDDENRQRDIKDIYEIFVIMEKNWKKKLLI